MDNFCGKRLDGRYEIKEIIGVGGMAVVYKAYDNIDDRVVAIKILKDEYLSNDEFKRRFKNESKAIAVLSHPNIVRVYNVSFGDRIQYIVMEYVDGITLKEYIEQQGAVNWKEAVHFMGQILAALQHAHDKGIVHQDIKPQNILLLKDGTIKVTDFGIARFSRADADTTSDKAIGSVHYISPEQARGEVTDEKADIYSVGVVMYEMLTGQLPFQSESAVSVAIMQLQNEAKRPREIVPSIPIGLEQITMRAMQKNPNSRYRSSAEMLMDINDFKRNPSIKFDYSYFVDQEPTKYIRANNLSGREQRFTNESNAQVEEKASMNKTTAVMLGAIAGIIVLGIVIAAILFGFKNQKVEVPNFSGFNYYTQIENEKKYTDKFVFEIEMVENSTLDDGTVISQDPISSTKVNKGSTITLTIAQKNSILLDTSIIGMTEEKAKSYLNQRGIISTIITEYSETMTPGCVIKTAPEVGSTVKIGSEVTLYIATDTKETVKMPDIQGTEREMAESQLKAAGLEIGVVTEVDSELEAGIVVQQSIEPEADVPVGSKIDFTVSNGNPPESSVDVFVTLPSVNKTGILKIYINSVIFYTSEELYLDGATKQFTLTGSGVDNTYTITIDDSPVQKGKVDFSQNPAVITEVEEITFDNKVVMNNVVGMTQQEAVDRLTMAGFKAQNIETLKQPSTTIPEGVVISQVPVSDGTTKFSTNESITLVVSSGPPAA